MKRFLYIVAVLLVSVLLMGGTIVAALMSSKVETAAVQLATSELSKALGTHATVGNVQYHFPARLTIRDIYIEDRQHDTLLFIGELHAHFSPLALRHNEIRFSHARLKDVNANLYRLDSTEWNYTFLVDAFRSDKPKDNTPMSKILAVKDVQLDNLRVRIEDYNMLLPQAEIDLHELSPDRFDAQISKGQMTITKGWDTFAIESLQAHLIANDSVLSMPTIAVRLPNSGLDLSGLEIQYPIGDTLYLSRSAHDIRFALTFNEAHLVPADIALFVPRLRGLTQSVELEGALSGTLDSLAFNNIVVRYAGRTVLAGNVSAVGLPDFSNPYLRANLTQLQTNAARLQDFLSRLYLRPVRLPLPAHRLGNIRYRGLAEGRLHDLTLHGAFRTDIGTITTDGSFHSDSLFERMDYNARLAGRKLKLGRLIAHPQLQSVSFDFTSVGHIQNGKVSGDVDAYIRELTYDNYTYDDLHLKGSYEPQRYAGHFHINDPHINLAFDGVVDLHDINPEINFNLQCMHFDTEPFALPFIKTRFNLAVDLNGAKPEDISGYMVLDSLFLATSRDSMLLKQWTVLAQAGKDSRKIITSQSDCGNGQLEGAFRYTDVIPAMQAMMHNYLPSAVNAPDKAWEPVSFTLKADGERLRDIQRLFIAPVILSDHPSLHAVCQLAQEIEPHLDVRFFAPGVRAGKTPVHDLTMTINTVDTLHHPGASGSGLALSVSAEAMQTQTVLSTLAFHDTLLTHLTLRRRSVINEQLPEGWQQLSPRQLQRALSDELSIKERQQALLAAQRAGDYGGDIRIVTHFARYNKKPFIDLHFLPGTLLLRDSVYTIDDAHITYCAADTTLSVDHFAFAGGGALIRANGLASRSATDTLAVQLQRVDASYVVPFLLPVQTIMFNGLLTGQAAVTSVLRKPLIDTQIHIDSMGLNNCLFGDAEVDLHISDSLAFHADVYRPQDHSTVVDLNGKALFDGSGTWKLDMTTDHVPLAFINHWTSAVLNNLDGTGTGRVIVGGSKELGVYVLVRAMARQASLTLPWTNVRYTIPADTIVLDTTAIIFPNVHLVDAFNNPVLVNGQINHNQFQHFGLDLHVNADKALVFDQNKTGEPIQGHVFGSGHVDVTGPEDNILVSAEARTEKNSSFRLSLDNASSAYESTFIHFVEHPDSVVELHLGETDLDNIDIEDPKKTAALLPKRAAKCVLKLNLDVNPRLLFQLVLGERNGDVISARGSGGLSLTYDTETEDIRLLGTYDIDEGTLSYTIANVIRKEFTVGEGSVIAFSGDPTNPLLNVTAKYRVTANLHDLFGQETEQLSTTRSNIPVLTCMHITGNLSAPILSFALEFPLSDQAIQQQVRQVINTDEMLMRQVIYLLVFSRFFTPDYMANSQMATLNSTYSLLSSTVTGQINAWLSKLTNILTVGVAIRTDGEGAGTSQEYEAQFQLQPLERLLINGNVGYRYNDAFTNQPFFGDLEVEVKLTEDGQWRLKGYTHTVDKYSLRQASTIQGVGVVWKYDF